jgi:signal transduction histidine kinase
MHDVRRSEAGSPLSDMVLTLDRQYADVLALLDGRSALRRMVSTMPGFTGLDVGWVGEPDGNDRIVLGGTVNTATDLIDGLVVPEGLGLGGQVLAAQRPLWVGDYCTDHDITGHFKSEVAAERIKAMIAVPIVHDGRLLGVLYGASRNETSLGDRVTFALEQVAARAATAQIIAERARHAADVAVHEERRRLSVELHDTVGAMLYTVGAGIRTLGAEAGLDDEVRARLRIIEQQAAEAAAALRGSLRVLNTPPEQVALGVALREHCRAFEHRTGLSARVIMLTELPPLHGSRIGALSCAAREALLNVEKHAGAQSVIISVFAQRDGVAIAVSDDGAGLPAGRTRRAGLGLASVADRLARVGGEATLSGNDDGGATLQAWVPA